MQFRAPASAILRRAAEVIATRTPTQLTDAQAAARSWSLAQFLRWCWPIIEPSRPLVWGWPLDAICLHIEALLTGTLGTQNLTIQVPPGYCKSTVLNVAAVAWEWTRHPSRSFICASGNESVSIRDSLRCRTILESAHYAATFGRPVEFSADQNMKGMYQNTARGFRRATTTGARITGDRADRLLIDDPLDASDSYSKAAREAVGNWYFSAFANRLNDPAHGVRCIIAQRLHVDDLVGRILEVEGRDWTQLVIPQEWEESRRAVTPIGWRDPRTRDGDLAFEARFPAPVVAAERMRLGNSGFDGQHQQRPSAAMGEIFRRDALQLWPAAAALPHFTRTIISIDSAFKTGEENDYSVAVVLGDSEKGPFILDVIRGRFTYPILKATMTELSAKWRPDAVLIEDKASGQSLIQDLQTSTKLPVVVCAVDGDKVMRANICVPTWEAGRVHARDDSPWLPDFLDELYAFPKGAHDDQVDSFTQGLRYLNRQPEGFGIMQWYAAKAAEVEARTALVPALAPAPDAQPAADIEPPWHRAAAVSDLPGGLQLSGVAGFLK